MVIEKKIWPKYFEAIKKGKKKFELRLVEILKLAKKELKPKLKIIKLGVFFENKTAQNFSKKIWLQKSRKNSKTNSV